LIENHNDGLGRFAIDLRKKLDASTALIGTVLTLPGATLAELTAPSFDVLWLDLEHGAIGRSDLSDVLVGVAAAGVPILVRVPDVESDLVTVALDSGCAGLVFPNIESSAEMKEAVLRCTYPPIGNRGFGPRRANGHGRSKPWSNPVVVAQIESQSGLDEISGIAGVKGLDVLVVGTADLSYNLGKPGSVSSPEVVAGVALVAEAAVRAGIHAGVAGPPDPVALESWSKLPLSMFVLSTEARIFTSALDDFAQRIRDVIAPREQSSCDE
jgi:4-hydroxy-2-oxoheptanedioate aldolase